MVKGIVSCRYGCRYARSPGLNRIYFNEPILLMLAVFAYTVFAISEKRRSLNPRALAQGFADVPHVIKDAGLLALKHPTLSILLVALALFLMATNPVEVIWPTHAKPMLDDRYANSVVGAVTASYFFSIAVGASLSSHISRIFRGRHAITLSVIFACLVAVQIALALQDNMIGFVAIFILYSVILGASETPASSILHSCVEDRQRSTMLSLRSLVQQLGAAIGLVLVGAVAEAYTTPTAWMAGTTFLVIALLLMVVLARRLRAEE